MSRRLRHLCLAVIAALVLIAAVFAVTKPPSPDGRYVFTSPPVITGDYYYEFSGGKIYFQDYENSGRTNHQDMRTTYFQKPDGWYISETIKFMSHGTLVTNSATYKIHSTWSGLSFIDDTGKPQFFRRRLFPGKRPEWMTTYLPWAVQ